MEIDQYERQFHFEKNYMEEPRKLGNIRLVQIGRTHCSDNYIVGDHTHRNWLEITCVTQGAGTVVTNGVASPVKRGDIYVSFPGDIHSISSDDEELMKFDFLTFWPQEPEIEKALEQIMVVNNDPHRRIITNRNIETLIDNSISECILNDKFSEDMLMLTLNAIVRYIIRDFSFENKAKKLRVNSSQELCYRMMNYINTHIYAMEDLDDLAEYFGYSYGYLSGVFHKTTGDTLRNYYAAYRAESAKALINEGVLSFAKIAETLQYSSIYSFSRAFKNHTGMSPSAYKKQVKLK